MIGGITMSRRVRVSKREKGDLAILVHELAVLVRPLLKPSHVDLPEPD
jgi:hypothetical protein